MPCVGSACLIVRSNLSDHLFIYLFGCHTDFFFFLHASFILMFVQNLTFLFTIRSRGRSIKWYQSLLLLWYLHSCVLSENTEKVIFDHFWSHPLHFSQRAVMIAQWLGILFFLNLIALSLGKVCSRKSLIAAFSLLFPWLSPQSGVYRAFFKFFKTHGRETGERKEGTNAWCPRQLVPTGLALVLALAFPSPDCATFDELHQC